MYGLGDILFLTLFAMLVVFVVLLGIWGLMVVMSKILNQVGK
ncbi:OadG family protein [Enterococcus cecorum]|nr:OadG family protein [Enterococcus cecorum]MCJ0599487.1 OadG family protein [Enterococcus cecorum]MCJ0602558.1 OadG family protein [Enterococcus cecorum]MDZ5505264.1 OadG family protein [Enterococcus cecorum]MDZ5532685.1 OadG family protein [Enterococcus cecorum]MDZ5545888.1 OadG family protein [Enterococcus cecorum]